jgi:hypothetical protein
VCVCVCVCVQWRRVCEVTFVTASLLRGWVCVGRVLGPLLCTKWRVVVSLMLRPPLFLIPST